MFWTPEITVESGPFKTILKRGEFLDHSRVMAGGASRPVPYKIYLPVEHDLQKIPLIIWSHGFGGNRDGAAFLSRFLASYGYAIAHLTHFGTDSSLWEGKPGHPWDILRKVKIPRETTIDRFMDVPFALDALEKWAKEPENAEFGKLLDFENLGMSGHSFGSMTSQVMAGQMFPDVNGHLTSMKEDRFKAGILYSPVPIAHLSKAPPEELYGPIDLPLLHMTGTEDDSPIEGFGYKQRMAVYEHSSSPEKFALIKKGGDHMVYNGTRGKLDANPLRERHEELIKIFALAYWDYKLKGDTAAKGWLEGPGVEAYLGEDGWYKHSSKCGEGALGHRFSSQSK